MDEIVAILVPPTRSDLTANQRGLGNDPVTVEGRRMLAVAVNMTSILYAAAAEQF